MTKISGFLAPSVQQSWLRLQLTLRSWSYAERVTYSERVGNWHIVNCTSSSTVIIQDVGQEFIEVVPRLNANARNISLDLNR